MALRLPSGALPGASPRSVGCGCLLVHSTLGGAVGLLGAGIDFPISAAHDIPPAPDFPVGPEPARMIKPGVDDLERAVRRRGLAQKVAVEPLIATPKDDGLVGAYSAGMEATHADRDVLIFRRGHRVREGGRNTPTLRGVVILHYAGQQEPRAYRDESSLGGRPHGFHRCLSLRGYVTFNGYASPAPDRAIQAYGAGLIVSSVDLGEDAGGRVEKPGGFYPAFVLSVGAPAGDGSVGP